MTTSGWRDGRAVATAAGIVLAAGAGWPVALAAQDDGPVPTVPAGTPAVLFPLQDVRPTPGGAWPGGGASEREVLEILEAEIAFAFGEERDARNWALPSDIVRRLNRNPMLRVDPHRLAYHGLLREPRPEDQIYEPLHSQLRQVAALFDARIVVLPLTLWYRTDPPPEGTGSDKARAEAKAGAEAEKEARGEAAAEGEAAKGAASDTTAPRGRAVMLAAVIDIRRSRVLWHGEIESDAGEPDSSRLLTTLALRLADQLIP